MATYHNEELQALWIRWRAAQQAYLASEQSLHAFESRIAPNAAARPHDLISRAESLREARDRASAAYRTMDLLFTATRDSRILEDAAKAS